MAAASSASENSLSSDVIFGILGSELSSGVESADGSAFSVAASADTWSWDLLVLDRGGVSIVVSSSTMIVLSVTSGTSFSARSFSRNG